MAIARRDDWLTTPQGQALAGAEVWYLTQPADTSSYPPTPAAPVYTGTTGTPGANPQLTDGYGHAVAYLNNTELYTVAFYHPLLGDEPLVLTDQVIGGGGGGGSFTPFGVIPTGTIDGTNKVFELPVLPQLCVLNLNGLTLQQGLGYTISGSTITFAAAPAVGDNIYAQGLVTSGSTAFNQVPQGNIDGANVTFTLANSPVLLFLVYNGQLLQPGVGYTLAGDEITMAGAPSVGDTLFAQGVY